MKREKIYFTKKYMFFIVETHLFHPPPRLCAGRQRRRDTPAALRRGHGRIRLRPTTRSIRRRISCSLKQSALLPPCWTMRRKFLTSTQATKLVSETNATLTSSRRAHLFATMISGGFFKACPRNRHGDMRYLLAVRCGQTA